MSLKPFRNRVKPEKKAYAKKLRNNMTEAEKILWERLKAKRLIPKAWRHQYVILGWIADFYCPAYNLVVEVDGGYHDDRKEQDEFRDAVMTDHGFKVMRFTNDMIMNDLYKVLNQIRKQCGYGLSDEKIKELDKFL